MRHHKGRSRLDIGLIRRNTPAVHGLNQEIGEAPARHRFGIATVLRPDEFQFVPPALDNIGPRFRTDTDPINSGMGFNRAVAFDGDGEPPRMQTIHQRIVDLQHRFPAGEHNITVGLPFAP